MRAQAGLPLALIPDAPSTSLADRVSFLERTLADLKVKEAACSQDSSTRGLYSNPWTGLRRQTERVLARLRGEPGR